MVDEKAGLLTPAGPSASRKTKPHSAIIYFHGVGDPQRHLSLGKFLDHFDLYGQRQDKHAAGKPRSYSYSAELFPGEDEVTNFVEFKRVIERNGSPAVARVVRVYEAYWVPEARSRFSFPSTMTWLVWRVFSPIRYLVAPWRAFPAIRLLCLFKLAEEYSTPGHLEKLERFYRDFENWESRSLYPRGTLKQFETFVRSKVGEAEASRLLVALRAWRAGSRTLALRQFAKLVSLFGAITVTLVAGALFCSSVVSAMHEVMPLVEAGSTSTSLYSAALFITASLLLVYRVARTYVYDVISWTLESERSFQFASRERVIRYSQRLIRKVAAHPGCSDVTIVSHSLGSCIATEALLQEGTREKARERQGAPTFLHKVRSIFTIGSPLDLIFFFFQADQTFSHRYNRIQEERRLSIGLPPFQVAGRKTDTMIYNVWSRFDPISSSMHSLRKRMSEPRGAIVNFEVLPPAAPMPLGTHTSYFADPNLMSAIYSSVMGTKPRLDRQDLAAYFKDHNSLRLPALRWPWLLPTIGLCGLKPASTWLSFVGLIGGYFVIGAVRRRRLLSDYEIRFGRFLKRSRIRVD